MAKRILVVYASRGGSTAEVADTIAQELSYDGVVAEATSIKGAKNITSFDAIVLGTAIRMGRPLPEMVSFVKSYRPILSTKKVALFGLCMTLKDDTPENRKLSESYLAPLTSLFSPVDKQMFAGKIDPARIGLLSRFAIKMVKAPIGDFRLWDTIRNWARALNSKL